MIGWTHEQCSMWGLPGYDAWKTRTPDWCEGPEEEGPCVCCGDSGWLAMWVEDENDPDREIIIACTECSMEIDVFDLEEIEEAMVLTPGAAPGYSVPQTDALAVELSQDDVVARVGVAPTAPAL